MWASAEGGAPEVTLETSMGPFTVELYYKHAPRTCRNFIELSRRGYYDNVKFHRIIKNFIVQGGDPTGTGRGGESIYGLLQHIVRYCRNSMSVEIVVEESNYQYQEDKYNYDGYYTQGKINMVNVVRFMSPKFEDEVKSELKHSGAGVLSMANAGPNTNGSQFFITLAPCPSLDGKHTIFGRVCRGMEIIKRLGSVQTDNNDRPVLDVKILRTAVKD